jgi:DinB superfamily
MSKDESVVLRRMLVDAMRGDQAHLDFDSAVKDFPAELRGVKPHGAPHTAWELLEHIRIAQRDILDFSHDPKHQSPEWPKAYWPSTEAPPDEKAWDKTVRAFQKDAREFHKLVEDPTQDLFKVFEHGDGQTLLREAVLVASHNSYHLGQFVFLKKMLVHQR